MVNKNISAEDVIEIGNNLASSNSKGNSFLIITGDNGSGKSTLLMDVIAYHRKQERLSKYQSKNTIEDRSGRKVIAYSMAPFSKFDAGYSARPTNRYQRIGGGSSGNARYALLFQAIVAFCISEEEKKPLFDDIAKITNFSALFRIRLQIDRSRIVRYPRNDLMENTVSRQILDATGSIDLYMKPGAVIISSRNYYSSENSSYETPPSAIETVFPLIQGSTQDIADGLLLLRRYGALRVLRIEYSGNDDEWHSADKLSSGQLSLFVGLMVLASTIEDESVILIDEPEISLHPAWQEKFCQLIHKISQYHYRCNYVIATHSPMIVSSSKNIGAKTLNLGSEMIASSDLIDSEIESIEEVFAVYFNTLTQNSHFVKGLAVKASHALMEGNSKEFKAYTAVLRKIKEKIDDQGLKVLIAELLKRSVP